MRVWVRHELRFSRLSDHKRSVFQRIEWGIGCVRWKSLHRLPDAAKPNRGGLGYGLAAK